MVLPQFGVGRTTFVQQQQANLSPGQRLAQGVMHADAQAEMQQQQQWVSSMLRLTSKPNTKAAYDPKGSEFLEFCSALYSNQHIDFEKIYRFLFYVSHRSKRRRGRKKAGSAGQSASRFDEAEYHQV